MLLDFLEPRRLFAATPVGAYPFGGTVAASVEDADGTVAKFSLPGGQGVITVADDGWHVAVTKATAAAALSITTAGGDGRVTLAEFSSSKPLGSINAPKANLSGAMNLTNVKAVTLGNVSDLSVTSTSPLASLTLASWGDTGSPPDSLTLPSLTSLSVKGNFAPAVTISSKKVALNSATVGGTVSGVWAVAGSVGTLKLHAVRSPDLTIGGSVTQVSLDDCIAVSQVASSTGGVIHFGGKGSVSAAKGKDKFQVAKNITIYTCSADMYTWSDLYQYDRAGRTWTYTKNGKKDVQRVVPTGEVHSGHPVYTINESGPASGSDSYYADGDGRGYIYRVYDRPVTYTFAKLAISPRVYRLGATTTTSSGMSGGGSQDGISVGFSGTATFATRLVGHELVSTPAGTFLAAKLVSSLRASMSGSASNGVESLPLKGTLTGSMTEYAVPGVGLVRYDNSSTGKLTVAGETESSGDGNHAVLTKMPTGG